MALDATKSRLLEAAGEEFAERGFEGATIRAIIERAGANLAAVNYHFGDKEKLYIQAVIEAHRCGMDAEPDEEGSAAGLPTSEQLRAYIRHFLGHVLAIEEQDSWHRKLMLREMVRPTRALETLVSDVIRPKFERLRAILSRACPEAGEDRLIATTYSVIGQCLFYKMARPVAEGLVGVETFARLDLEFLTDHIAGFSLAALGLGPPIGCEERGANGPETAPTGQGEVR